MAQSLINYVKNNPVESALAVGSIVPVVRGASLLYKGYKRAKKLGKILSERKSVYLYRGVPDKKVTLSEAKKKIKQSTERRYGDLFTSHKKIAIGHATGHLGKLREPSKGLLYRIKVTPTELRRMKQTVTQNKKINTKITEGTSRMFTQKQRFISGDFSYKSRYGEGPLRGLKLKDRQFYGVVPANIRRRANLIERLK